MITLKSDEWRSPSMACKFNKPFTTTDEPKITLVVESHPDEDSKSKLSITLDQRDAQTLAQYILNALGGT